MSNIHENINAEKNKFEPFTIGENREKIENNIREDIPLQNEETQNQQFLIDEDDELLLDAYNEINIEMLTENTNTQESDFDIEIAQERHSVGINTPSHITQNIVNNALATGNQTTNQQENNAILKQVIDNLPDDASLRLTKKVAENPSAEMQKEALDTVFTSVFNLVEVLRNSANEQNDSQEFKDVKAAANALLNRMKIDGPKAIVDNKPSDLMVMVDNLYDACSIYNAKNRGYRWSPRGSKRQKYINETLNTLNWNMKKLSFLRGEENSENNYEDISDNPIINILSKPIRTPMNTEFLKDMENADYYDIKKTKEDVESIAKFMNLPDEERKGYTDYDIVSLNIIQSRNLSHIFLNEKEIGKRKDSSKILEIKDSVYRIERLLSQKSGFDANTSIEDLQAAYQVAISQCKDYINKKSKRSENDRKNIERINDTLLRMEDEYRQISLAKRLIEEGQEDVNNIKEPLDLLVLSGIELLKKNYSVQEATEKDTIAAYSLAIEDFQKLLGAKNDGSVSFENGKLVVKEGSFIKNSFVYGMYSLITGNDSKPSVTNRQMKERLFYLVSERLGNAAYPGYKNDIKNVRISLGLDSEERLSLPIDLDTISYVMRTTSYPGSVMFNETIRYNDEEESTEKTLMLHCSQEIENLFKQETDSNNEYLYEPDENQKRVHKDNVNKIFQAAKKHGLKVPKLSNHKMNNITNGNIVYVMDEMYLAFKKVYKYQNNINGDLSDEEKKRLYDYMGSEEVKNKVAALCMLKFSAQGEEERLLYEYELEDYLKLLAYTGIQMHYGNFQSHHEKMNISELSEGGAEGLDDLIERKFSEVRPWQNKNRAKDVRRGGELIKNLCENLSELNRLKDEALTEGLYDGQAERIKELGRLIQQSLDDKEDFRLMDMVTKELKNTRFEAGIIELKKRRKEKFSFANSTVGFVSAFELKKEGPARDHNSKEKNDPKVLSAEEKISLFSGKSKLLIEALRSEVLFSELITEQGNEGAEIQAFKSLLRTFTPGKSSERNITISGINGRLIQKEDNTLHVIIEDHVIPLNKSAYSLANSIEENMVANTSKYGEEGIGELLDSLDVSGDNQGVLIHARNLCTRYLAGKTGKPETFFTNITSIELKKLAMDILSGTITADALIRQINDVDNRLYINGQETRELLSNLDRLKEKSAVEIENNKISAPENDWNEEEKSVLNLISELFYTSDTWKVDDETDNKEKSGVRIIHAFRDNIDGLITVLTKPKIIENIIDEIPIVQESTDKETSEKVSVKKLIMDRINGMFEEYEEIKNIAQMGEEAKPTLAMALIVAEVNPEYLKKASELENTIDEIAGESISNVQGMVKEAVKSLYPDEEQNQERLENMEIDVIKSKSVKESTQILNNIIESAAKGTKGKGLFIRNVLENYFDKVNIIDKRAMFASAIRNARKKPDIDGKSQEEIEIEIEKAYGNFLGGLLKGAGPLLQKELQGMPMEGIPLGIQSAITDMKSNLAPIPDRIVEAQMQNIVDRSKGEISRIVVKRSLGAASVGQTFLCKVYGPNMPTDGEEKVVKLLRPDVRNRMMREKNTMLECARLTDIMQNYVPKEGETVVQTQIRNNEGNVIVERTIHKNRGKNKDGGEEDIAVNNSIEQITNYEIGGMEATYEGQLLRIEEELDLTIEAKNVQKGSLYDRGYKTVKSMKVDTSVETTTNSMVLEKADGETVDKYINGIKEIEQKWQTRFQLRKKDDGTYEFSDLTYDIAKDFPAAMEELISTLNSLQKRQRHLANMSKTWVTEGIYGDGFYHGDLHAGNIMIDDEKVTLIDFGNATKLSEEQMKHVTRMMTAAAIGKVDIFEDSFHALLKNTPKEKYDKNRQKLREILKKVFVMGDVNATGQRIAAALLEIQTLGLELPPEIFNFSQSQLRLQNTLDDVNAQIENIKAIINITSRPNRRAVTVDNRSNYHPFLTNLTGPRSSDGIKFHRENLNYVYIEEDKDKLLSKLKEALKDRNKTRSFKEKYIPSVLVPSEQGGKVPLLSEAGTHLSRISSAITDIIDCRETNKPLDPKQVLLPIGYNGIMGNMFYNQDALAEYRKLMGTCDAESIESMKINDLKRALEIVNTELETNPTILVNQSFEKLIDAYNEGGAEGGVQTAELKNLEDDFHQKYKANREKEMLDNIIFKIFGGQLDALRKSDKFEDLVEKMRKDVIELQLDESLPNEVSDNILQTYEELVDFMRQEIPEDLELAKQHELELKMKQEEYMTAWRPALQIQFGNTLKWMRMSADMSEPESFVMVMGRVIGNNVRSSFKKFGRWNSIKYYNTMERVLSED